VPSVEPSSTTISSQPWNVCSRIEAIAAPIEEASFRAARTTDTDGFDGLLTRLRGQMSQADEAA
jgi:hypothetical protein